MREIWCYFFFITRRQSTLRWLMNTFTSWFDACGSKVCVWSPHVVISHAEKYLNTLLCFLCVSMPSNHRFLQLFNLISRLESCRDQVGHLKKAFNRKQRMWTPGAGECCRIRGSGVSISRRGGWRRSWRGWRRSSQTEEDSQKTLCEREENERELEETLLEMEEQEQN